MILCVTASACLYAQESQPQGKIVQMGKTIILPQQERDSVLIADQLFYGFELENVEEGTQFAFPQVKDTLMTNIRIVKPWQMDTLKASKARKGQPRLLDLRGGLTITSFDEGIYYLPPLAVRIVRERRRSDIILLVAIPMAEKKTDCRTIKPRRAHLCIEPVLPAMLERHRKLLPMYPYRSTELNAGNSASQASSVHRSVRPCFMAPTENSAKSVVLRKIRIYDQV